MEVAKFYEELNALQELMVSYENWVTTADEIGIEALDISKQLEQCKVSELDYP